MTQEEKDLLLKDLSARLPYGVKVRINHHHAEVIYNISSSYINDCPIHLIEPYLRPMSSMTEEEKKEFSVFGFEVIDHINADREECPKYQVIEVSNFSEITEFTYWLISHHFDYRGLIPMGLAIEATEDMYR